MKYKIRQRCERGQAPASKKLLKQVNLEEAITMPASFWRRTDVPPAALWLYISLWDVSGKTGTITQSTTELLEYFDMSRQKMNNLIKALVVSGLLKRKIGFANHRTMTMTLRFEQGFRYRMPDHVKMQFKERMQK